MLHRLYNNLPSPSPQNELNLILILSIFQLYIHDSFLPLDTLAQELKILLQGSQLYKYLESLEATCLSAGEVCKMHGAVKVSDGKHFLWTAGENWAASHTSNTDMNCKFLVTGSIIQLQNFLYFSAEKAAFSSYVFMFSDCLYALINFFLIK